MMGEKAFERIDHFFPDKSTVSDILAKCVITFGVVLLVGGLYLMIVNPAVEVSSSQGAASVPSAFAGIEWVPGVPLFKGDLASIDALLAGSVYWIFGFNMLLVGLGLWVRHRFARLAGLFIFALAAFFDFAQFLLGGFLGAPFSVVMLLVDVVFVYLLLSKFDVAVSSPLSSP
jgi:hypothetical protein